MRKLARIVVLAVLFTPALASAQLSLGARLGYGFAMGELGGGGDVADILKAQIPIQLDLGYRVTPALTLGGYFAYGFGRVGGDFEDVCDLDGVECTGRVYRVGLQLDYAFRGPSATPWLGAGFGYEWTSFTGEGPGGEAEFSFRGIEFLNLQGGLDWKVGDRFSIGPFALLSVGQFSRYSVDAGDTDESGEVPDQAFHQWLQLGVRGRFDL